MMSELLEQAKELMLDNWNGEYTIPGPGLYPHHWGWDTPVVAAAYTCFDVEKGMQELRHLLEAQWDNGMIPHIVFNEEATSYFPGPAFYDVHRSDDAPQDIHTSGMIQEPTQAIGLYYLYKNHSYREDVCGYVEEMYPRILDFHRYLMEYRDPENSGAITILHPWECMDDLPVWDEALARLELENVPDYERKDLDFVASVKERPPDEFYDCYIYLLDRMRKHDYDFRTMYPEHPFKFKDVVNTSILYLANNCLLEIASAFSFDMQEIQEWQELISSNFSDNFQPSDESDHYFCYDMIGEKYVEKATIASLLPIFSGVLSAEEAQPLINSIETFQFCGRKCIVPVIPTTSFEHENIASSDTYWRGPVWAMTTWMIYCGLREYGRDGVAELLKNSFLRLVESEGFREYYSPTTGEGKGIDRFTWTAAVVVDMMAGNVQIPGYLSRIGNS